MTCQEQYNSDIAYCKRVPIAKQIACRKAAHLRFNKCKAATHSNAAGDPPAPAKDIIAAPVKKNIMDTAKNIVTNKTVLTGAGIGAGTGIVISLLMGVKGGNMLGITATTTVLGGWIGYGMGGAEQKMGISGGLQADTNRLFPDGGLQADTNRLWSASGKNPVSGNRGEITIDGVAGSRQSRTQDVFAPASGKAFAKSAKESGGACLNRCLRQGNNLSTCRVECGLI